MTEAAFANIRRWREHPSNFVREVFGATPDPWQHDVLEAFPHNQRIAMQACKGPGKTCLLSWLCWNFLLTRPYPKIAATSITADNLADNLWTEMANWQQRSELLKAAFEWQKTRIISKDHPETWWMSARSWPKGGTNEEQANTLAGLHADYIMFVLDESGGIPDSVMVSADAALSSCVEGHIVQAGNPTTRSGPLFRAATSARTRWYVVEITGDPDDPKRASRVKVEWAREQIEEWGRDDPWVQVNVFGRFPPGSFSALISAEEVEAAMARSYREGDISASPKILGVDVARFGDDSSVIAPRQGLVAFEGFQYRNLRAYEGADVVNAKWASFEPDAVFIDDTGGFGSGWIDSLKQLGRAPVGVTFNSSAADARFANKRTEMYFEFVNWIRRGGQLPPKSARGMDVVLKALCETEYTVNKSNKTILEPKESVKQKIRQSPDFADAYALTFAYPVTAAARSKGVARHLIDYDPFGVTPRVPSYARNVAQHSYDPFSGMV